jgi:hypothetical protein
MQKRYDRIPHGQPVKSNAAVTGNVVLLVILILLLIFRPTRR